MEQDFNVPSTDEQEEDNRSALDRFADAFTSPSSAASGLEQSTNRGAIIIIAFVIALVVSAFSTILIGSSSTVMDSIKAEQMEQLEKMKESGKLPADAYEGQLDQLDGMSATTFMISGAATATISMILEILIIGLIALIIIKILQRDTVESIGYGTALAWAAIAESIRFVSHIASAVGIYLSGNVHFEPTLSYLIGSENTFVSFFAGLVDPFMIWWLFVVGTGTAVIARGSRGRSMAIWTAIWIGLGLIMAVGGMLIKNAFGLG